MLSKKKFCIDPIIERFLNMLSPLMQNIDEMYMFGSRCRDNWRPDSDYDILIIVKKKDRKFINRIYDAIMDILLDTGRLISIKIFTISDFNRLKSIPTPFMQNVMEEGIKLGSHS